MSTSTQYRPSPLSASSATHTPAPASTYNKPAVAASSSPFSVISPRKKAMSITQTYYLAHKARAKLSHEAARADHDLRLLVGHANMLDSLMLELADAEREQESWFNQSVRGATKNEERQQTSPAAPKKERHIQWADAIVEEADEDLEDDFSDSSSDASDSDSDSDEFDEDVEMFDAVVPLSRVSSRQPISATTNNKPLLSVDEDESEDDMEDDLEEDYAQLELVRTTSHPNGSSSPPELDHDSDSSDEDEDDSMPPSPPNAILSFSEKEANEQISQQQTQAQSPTQQGDSFYSEGFYLPRRTPASVVSAISVY